jgi:hypothetical protein
LLFVAVLAGDLFFSGVSGMAQLAAPSADEGAAESAPVEREVEQEEAPKMLVITEAPAEGAEAPPAPDETPLAMELPTTPPPAAAAVPTATGGVGEADAGEEDVEPTSAPEGTPEPAAGGGEPVAESPAATSTPTAARAADAVAPTSTPPPLPEPATAEPTEYVLPDTAEPAPNAVEETEPSPGYSLDGDTSSYVTPWRAAEVALGVSALLLLVATIWVWRARRR